MTVRISALALAVLLAGCTSTVPPAEPGARDFSAACDRGQQALENARKTYSFPGAVLALSFGENQGCVVAVGLADVESGAPMQRDSRMLAASIGKTFVAGVVLRLAHDGVLALDDPVSRWLGDEPFFARLPNGTRITIRHLLSHTSGLPDHVYSEAFGRALVSMIDTDRQFAPRELIGFVLEQPALSEPGTQFNYSDTGYILLGLIIEKAAKRGYFDLAQEYFTGPLGLSLTTPSDQRSLPGLVPGYLAEANPLGLPTKSIGTDGKMNWNPATEWTGGGFVSNAADLSRWARAEFSGRAATYPYLDELLEGAPEPAIKAGYGLGVRMADSAFGRMIGHLGWIPGYVSAAYFIPRQDFAYGLQINSDIGMPGPEGNFAKINDAVLTAVFSDSSRH